MKISSRDKKQKRNDMSRKRSSFGKDTVLVQRSPLSSIQQRNNLTGNARVLKDHIGDICHLLQQWNGDLLEGVTTVSEIKRYMLDRIDSQKKTDSTFLHSHQLQVLSGSLHRICEKMQVVVERLGLLNTSILSIQRLEEMQRKDSPIFFTWPISKFAETSRIIYEMFRKEIELKVSIKEEICSCVDKNTLVFYSVAWIQQPYIEKLVNLYLEAMLKEMGHFSSFDKTLSDLNRAEN